jgi:hypothetical protein
MMEMYGPSSALAARRRTALAARLQLDALAERRSRNQARPALPGTFADAERANLGRGLAKACLARAETHSIVASVAAQAQRRRDWYSALRRELEERRFVGYQLITEGLRLIAPDEHRQFVDLAMEWLDGLEQMPARPAP